uniref:Uncharacterized protein n=1 Tax=Candidatus Kentrum sp. LFY TaxID=2126342 RepID=A0A450WIJ0_9GAMM|nr:MAG: hypothetical protein BECKLFY1418C_GA0070996_102625 [Candidatus Kentron sp. LFY]
MFATRWFVIGIRTRDARRKWPGEAERKIDESTQKPVIVDPSDSSRWGNPRKPRRHYMQFPLDNSHHRANVCGWSRRFYRLWSHKNSWVVFYHPWHWVPPIHGGMTGVLNFHTIARNNLSRPPEIMDLVVIEVRRAWQCPILHTPFHHRDR